MRLFRLSLLSAFCVAALAALGHAQSIVIQLKRPTSAVPPGSSCRQTGPRKNGPSS